MAVFLLMKPNPKCIGERSEAVLMARLLLRNEVVLRPFGDNQRYDLVLDRKGKFIRVQVKTGRIKNGVVSFSCCSNAGGYNKRSYRGDIDFFGVYCPDNDKTYIVPVNDVPLTNAYLRLEPVLNDKRMIFRYAKDYEL